VSKVRVKKLKSLSVEEASSSTLLRCNASTLKFENKQRTKPVNRALLKEIALTALAELGIAHWDLTFYLVDAKRMAEINETQMGHEGPTDVITFDYSDPVPRSAFRTPRSLLGEIFICVDVAVSQSREFRTTWQSEVVRYIVHALLHLCGHDDLKPVARREMKRHENRLVRKLGRDFTFTKIARAA